MWSSPSIPDLQQDEAPQECEPPEKTELLSDLACFRSCKPWLPGSRTGCWDFWDIPGTAETW